MESIKERLKQFIKDKHLPLTEEAIEKMINYVKP